MNEELRHTDLKLLVIEDRPRFVEEMREWLINEFHYSPFDSALTLEEAQDYLQKNHYDVIIADMYLGEETKTGGFWVLEEIERLGISSIVIILTANESYQDCRHAFRKGVFDYLSKNVKGNALEELHDSIQRALVYINRWGNRHNEAWITEHRDFLNAYFRNRYVAILNNAVMESAETEAELKKRLKERNLPSALATIYRVNPPLLHGVAIEQLLAQHGEGRYLEFKSSFQYNLYTQQEDIKIRHGVLKTIVAFLNADGGTLIIGVQDDKTVCGIENDLSTLKISKQNEDNFELHLSACIESHIGKDYVVKNLQIRFETIEDKRVCIVDVTHSTNCAFLDGKEFFIRSGNKTISYSLAEFYRYLKFVNFDSLMR